MQPLPSSQYGDGMTAETPMTSAGLPTAAHPPATAPANPEPTPWTACLTLREIEAAGAQLMPPGPRAYYEGAAADEVTLRDNQAAFERYRIVPRMMVPNADRDASVEVLGRRWPMPVAIAPMAVHGVAHPDGEVATVRAAATAGVPFALSTTSSRSIEDVADGAPDGRRWFQLYVQLDPGRSRELVERAQAAGYEALILTVDLPRLGYRERDRRSGWQLPPLGNFTPAAPATHAQRAHAAGFEMLEAQQDVGLTWDDIDTIRSWRGRPCDCGEGRFRTRSIHLSRGSSATSPSASAYRCDTGWNEAASLPASPS